jgi:hypothetical protein
VKTMSLRSLFNKRSIILSALLGTGCLSLSHTIRPKDEHCIKAGQETSRSPDQERLVRLSQAVREGLTGRALMEHASHSVRMCFDKSLSGKVSHDGFIKLGFFSGFKIALNPDTTRSDTEMVLIMIHEARHYRQKQKISWDSPGNIPERERVAYYLFMEADARMASVVYAHEREQQGKKEYMNFLRSNSEYFPLISAFETSLKDKPGDMPAAIRAGVTALKEVSSIANHYAALTADNIISSHRNFNPGLPADSLLQYRTLDFIAATNIYGNYMTPELAEHIRGSFTDQQYREIEKTRREKKVSEAKFVNPVPVIKEEAGRWQGEACRLFVPYPAPC